MDELKTYVHDSDIKLITYGFDAEKPHYSKYGLVSKNDTTSKTPKQLYVDGDCRVLYNHPDGYRCEYTLKNGYLHSFNDEPAEIEIYDNGEYAKTWYTDGIIDRENGPADVFFEYGVMRNVFYIDGEWIGEIEDFIDDPYISDDFKIEMVLKYG